MQRNNPESAGGIAEALGGLRRGEAIDEISSECFVLAMQGIGGLKEEASFL